MYANQMKVSTIKIRVIHIFIYIFAYSYIFSYVSCAHVAMYAMVNNNKFTCLNFH